jgi:N-acetylglucosaminyl-diphospho-decaprenol L-rhamnosyltransferase
MKICGVVLNYFGHPDTIPCVQTLLNQNGLEKIIIIENSTDRNELSVLEHTFKNERQVEILTPSQNLGFAGGVNLAVSCVMDSCFDAFLLLNNDTVVPPNTVKHLTNGMITHGFDLVAPIIYCYPEKHKLWAKGYYYNRFSALITQRNTCFVPGTLFYLSGCCILIRCQVFKQIGLLDPTFFMYGEDIEFCFRAVQSGFRIGIVHNAHIYHKANVSSQLNSLFYEYHINRCHFLLCNKLSKKKAEQNLSLVIKLFTLSIRTLLRTFKFRNTHAISGYKQAILEFTNQDKLTGSDT